jgi:hypothetical protein
MDPVTPTDPVTPEPVAVSTPITTAVATPSTSPDPQTPVTPSPSDFNTAVPEAFRDKPYMKEVDSFDKLFADFDNAQALIGQKTFDVPKADAPESEIAAFTDKIRPESKDVYEFPETEYTKKFGKDEAFQGEMSELFHKAGLLPHQAKMLVEGYDGAIMGKAMEVATQAETQAADFEKLADGHFGADKDAKLKIANDLLKEHTPDAFKEKLANLDNESLMIMTGILNDFHGKYMSEDTLNLGGEGSAVDGTAVQEEARQLMTSPAYKDFRHPQHDEVVNKVNQLYSNVGKMKK